GLLTPAATKIFNKIKEAFVHYIVDWNGLDLYQVKGPHGDQCVVNLTERNCSCRKWEVSGIPCKHAVACIHDMADHGMEVGLPEAWVHPAYKLDTWRQQYSFKINPVNGRNLWQKNKWPTTLLPPKVVVPIGRPPKKRKRSAGEVAQVVNSEKIGRKGLQVTCSACKGKGHNKRGCKTNASSPQPSQGQATEVNASGSQPLPSQGNASQGFVGTPSASTPFASTPGSSGQKMTKRSANRNFSPTKKA
ncbi:zinc finger, SWIM-type containing protein, partial [Tanacetum coccineum]